MRGPELRAMRIQQGVTALEISKHTGRTDIRVRQIEKLEHVPDEWEELYLDALHISRKLMRASIKKARGEGGGR